MRVRRAPAALQPLAPRELFPAPSDAAWDAFVTSIPGGLYQQSTVWARVKVRAGWRTTRVAVGTSDRIVAGAQLLVRPFPLLGNIGYVPNGPLVPSGDVASARAILHHLLAAAARNRVRYLAVQPPSLDEALERELATQNFLPSPDVGRASVTLRIDVRRGAEDLLADMDKWTRRNIRRGQSHGVSVRAGVTGDLETFLAIRRAASARKGFATTRGDAYYRDMWAVLREGQHIEVFVAEYEGEPVSAMLAIAFGDTVYAHASAWTGRQGSHKPNEVLQWSVISWAKEHGYGFVDLEGIDARIADRIRGSRGESSDEPNDVFATRYKLGFGGQLTTLSVAYDMVPSGLLRWAYRATYPAFKKLKPFRALRNALRQVQPRN